MIDRNMTDSNNVGQLDDLSGIWLRSMSNMGSLLFILLVSEQSLIYGVNVVFLRNLQAMSRAAICLLLAKGK